MTWVVVVPCALVLVALAVANRQSVQVSIDPFSSGNANLAMSMPLFVVISLSMIAGAVAGGLIGWWQKMGIRRDLHTKQKEAEKLQRELYETQSRLMAQPPGTMPLLPSWSSSQNS